MADARQTNTQKLDEILRRLDSQPSIEEWYKIQAGLAGASETIKRIGNEVIELKSVVLIGKDGKPPVTQRLDLLEKITGWSGKAFWAAMMVLLGALGLGILRLIQLGAG